MAETDAEVGSLQAEFAALRHQIAAELGARDVPPPPPAPAPQTTSVAYTGSRPSYDELQPPDAEVMGHFYQLRESLLGGRGASQFCPNPHGDSTVALEMASNTLKIRPSEAGAVPPPPAAEATDDAMTAQYNELRASIAQRLASEAPPPTFAAAPPPAGDTDVNGDYYPVRGAEPAAGVQVVGEDTVVLNAAKPGRPGGAELFTAAPPPSRPADRAAARARQAPPAPTSAVVAAAAPRGIVAGAASERITFGHLAVREAIESHRRHYSDARAALRARATEAAPVATVSPNGPRLATAERAALREAVVNAAASEAAETEAVTTARATPRKPKVPRRPASAGGFRAPRASGVVPLLPVTGAGRPPSMEAVRAAERMAASASTVVLQPAAPELPDDLAAPTAQDSHVAIARDARAQEQALHEILNRSNEISRATIVSAGGA
jgi:hypothetical protein